MKTSFTGIAIAALLTVGSALPGFAEDATTPATPAPADTSSGTVARPSILPRMAEPTQPAADAGTAPHHRRYAHYRRRHWGNYRYAYWEPFPIYWPHLYHNHIHWNRIPWLFRF